MTKRRFSPSFDGRRGLEILPAGGADQPIGMRAVSGVRWIRRIKGRPDDLDTGNCARRLAAPSGI